MNNIVNLVQRKATDIANAKPNDTAMRWWALLNAALWVLLITSAPAVFIVAASKGALELVLAVNVFGMLVLQTHNVLGALYHHWIRR